MPLRTPFRLLIGLFTVSHLQSFITLLLLYIDTRQTLKWSATLLHMRTSRVGLLPRTACCWSESESESESYVTTNGQSASLSWNKAPIWGLRPDFYFRRTVAGLLMWGALSDERTGLSFTIATGASQRSHSRDRILLSQI
jgi:hypothetical protein